MVRAECGCRAGGFNFFGPTHSKEMPKKAPGPCVGPQCIGRRALNADKFRVEGLQYYRYKESQCAIPCETNSNLCKACMGREEKHMMGAPYAKSDWHGRIGGPLHPDDHIEGSEWNKRNRNREAKAKTKKTAKRTNARRNVSRRNKS